MVLKVDTSKKRLRKYKYMKGQGIVAKVDRLSKQVKHSMPSRKVYQQRITPYVSTTGNNDQSAVIACAQLLFPDSTANGFSNRQNPIIHCHKLEIMGSVITSSTADVFRVIVFQLTDAFEAGTAVNFFNPGHGSGAAPYTPLQPSNLCSQRYRILYDSGPRECGTSGGLKAQVPFRKVVNMKGQRLEFSNLTSTTPAQDNTYVVVYGTLVAGAGPTYITNTIADMKFQLTFSG